MNNLLSIHTVRFVVLILLQVLLFSNINFLGYINPYIYILFIILYPVKNNRILFLFISFLMGLIIDIFMDSGGINATAALVVAFIRPAVLKFSFGAVYEHQALKFNNIDFGQRLTYIIILTFIHHFTYFLFEIFNISKIILVLQNTLFSSIFTITLCILITSIFSTKSK
ncbi:rod shape-determining protein MreD [Olleya marilimosa]|uniref:Rod shape-determining protein MreD n=1 Tax=Olleya marilimosa TaxID=272164 RepID=A0ABR8M248_9FLAO|nr:rod shape-determining protein MreD [Olleya marilimosa]MBD3864622.1 rod shape-determining protein MreD [Olleya marilimosa]MBD3892103.1 rod shape-determining protein MreD [Olleya marilimosa]